jgi:hypothetical protein
MYFFIFGLTLLAKYYISVIEIFIEIGGIVEVYNNIGKHGIYPYIFGLFVMYTTHYYN